MAMWSTKRLPPALAGAALLLCAAACAHAPTNGRTSQAVTPTDHYPVRAVERREDVALAVHPQGALSAAQEAALAGFVQTWRDAGADAGVVVETPSTGGPDAQLTAQAAADRLVALGVPPAALRLGAFEAGPAPGAPVVARFEHLEASKPDCTKGWDNLVSTMNNDVSSHFGCANARNFAVMLADPHDLQRPRAMTPADAGRRATVLDNYRKGAVTSSARDEQANGVVSKAVN